MILLSVLFTLSCVLIISVCGISYQLFKHKCLWWDCAPERGFDIYEFDLSEEFFPEGAEVHELIPSRNKRGAIELGSTTNYWDGVNGIAIYLVYQFATENQASRIFSSIHQSFFNHKYRAPFEPNPAIEFDDRNADEYFIGCGDLGPGAWTTYRCGFVLRYKEYLFFFNAVIDEKMTVEDFNEIVTFINERMDDLLYSTE